MTCRYGRFLGAECRSDRERERAKDDKLRHVEKSNEAREAREASMQDLSCRGSRGCVGATFWPGIRL